jgi:alpha-L-rhamnosidase
VLTPGWTSYQSRVQVQSHDITAELADGGIAAIEVGQGWAVGSIDFTGKGHFYDEMVRTAAQITTTFADGTVQTKETGADRDCFTNPVIHTDIYHGEVWDSTHTPKLLGKAARASSFPIGNTGAKRCCTGS